MKGHKVIMNKKKLIINADDYGLTAGVSYGIIESNINGIVTSTTALPVSEHFEEAMELSKKFPSLKIGIHLGLTLNKTKPVLGDKVPSLTQADGTFHKNRDVLNHIKLEEVELEWRAQLEKFYATGHTPTHIDSHHNVHCYTYELFDIAKKLAKEYNLPIRNYLLEDDMEKTTAALEGVRTTERTIQRFYGHEAVTLENLEAIFKEISESDGEVFEVNCHPAFIDKSLQDKSSYLYERITELDVLRSQEAKDLLDKYNLELATFEIL